MSADANRAPLLAVDGLRVEFATRRGTLVAVDDVSFALAPGEVLSDPHLAARAVFADVGGLVQPEPAPRFSRTPGARGSTAPRVGEHTEAVLADFGFSPSAIARLAKSGAIGQG